MELIFAKFQEKDGELLEKEEAVEKLKSKIIDLNDGFERELEAKNSEKIKMHHKLIELQMQQQGLESSRDNSENCIRELQAMAKLEVEEKLSLIEKLEDMKVRAPYLYEICMKKAKTVWMLDRWQKNHDKLTGFEKKEKDQEEKKVTAT